VVIIRKLWLGSKECCNDNTLVSKQRGKDMFLKPGWTKAVCLVVVFLSGCSLFKPSERKELPVPVEITLGAAEHVNPSIQGRPSPIVVRVFELSNETKFAAASYFD